jgi:hypothetical protein
VSTAPAASNSPTLEYRRRHAVEAPVIDDGMYRPAWRRVDRIEKLHLAGAISAHEYRAAIEYRGTYERGYAGPGGLRAAELTAVRMDKNCRRPMPAMTETQARALASLRRIKETLGALYDLLELTIIAEMPWTAIGKRLHINQRTARVWCLAAVAALATL